MPNLGTSYAHNHQGPGLATVRRGSQGLSVAYCQNLLNARSPGQSAVWVDGLFGEETDLRVRRFQALKRLVSDGIVGPLTWAALEAGPPPIKRRPAGHAVSVPATGGV